MQDLLIGCGLGMRRKLAATFVVLTFLASTGCYHVRVIVPQPDPSTGYRKKTVDSLAWGALPKDKKKDVPADNCPPNAIDEVRTSSNLGYNLLTVGTLGFWSHSQVEWRCSKPFETPGTIHKKPKTVHLVLTAVPQSGSVQNSSNRKTAHTLAWGLLPQNVDTKCSDSNRMDEVRVGSNLGYSILTVGTLGFWSLTSVEWKCSKPPGQPVTNGNTNPLPQNADGPEAR